MSPACVVHEDDDLLVVNKPPGWNTHAPSPHTSEGIYDWLRHREARWANLAIIHRLDKDTSGLIVFSKSSIGNRSLTQQFESRQVQKRYLFLTDRPSSKPAFSVRSGLRRNGAIYETRPAAASSDEIAETHFQFLERSGEFYLWEARPLTGKTHQIRVHAADQGMPILGDVAYGGTAYSRVCLHAESLALNHPTTQAPVAFQQAAAFHQSQTTQLRDACIEYEATNAYRLIHGSADRMPGLYVDRLGDYLLAISDGDLSTTQKKICQELATTHRARGLYHKIWRKEIGADGSVLPQLILGEPAPPAFFIRENGLPFELSFNEGYSVGLFLDQRDNRRRLLQGQWIAPKKVFPVRWGEVLNTFSYTCGFSVAAARAGGHVTSLDLSKKYLEWGKRNFEINQLDPAAHDFIFGDVFDWCKRLEKKGRRFDLILTDPPSFSRSKISGVFQANKNFEQLTQVLGRLLKPGGILFASTNLATYAAETFLGHAETGLRKSGHTIDSTIFAPQPPDFPAGPDDPPYLKTVWIRTAS